MITATKRDKKALATLKEYVGIHGYAPSVRELAKALGYKHHASAVLAIDRLQILGWIEKDDGIARSIRVKKQED